jgi:hypothetical protein
MDRSEWTRLRGRRGVSVLPFVVVFGSLVLFLGFTGSLQNSVTRLATERVQAHRLRDLAISSAFEEACARVEAQLGSMPLSEEPRDLARLYVWADGKGPITVEIAIPVPEAVAVFAPEGVTFRGGVFVKSSSWKTKVIAGSQGESNASERGIVDLSVRLAVKVGSVTCAGLAKARRFITTRPTSGARVQARILPNTIASSWEEML